MEPKYEEMARQMRANGVSEEMIARFGNVQFFAHP